MVKSDLKDRGLTGRDRHYTWGHAAISPGHFACGARAFPARPRKKELAAFLVQGLQLSNQETTIALRFALRSEPATFAIFDAFTDEVLGAKLPK